MQAGHKTKIRTPQHQARPGIEKRMHPLPIFDYPEKQSSNKLKNKIAFITGGDSGIGKATAILFAKEGADIAISYLNEHTDARDTKRIIEKEYKKRCLLIPGNIGVEKNCAQAIKKAIREFGRIDILINNAGLHYEHKKLTEITSRQLLKTFETNIFFFLLDYKKCITFLKKGSCIINTASVTAYRGSPALMDYAATKGAIVAFTRSLATNLVKKGIRVNGVAPGPVWTPLIPSSLKATKAAMHGSSSPMERSGEPAEIAPCYLFLASDDSSYMTGQFLHPNGGEIING